ncbi:uncharacterized protein LOC113474217 [Ciona intestinalis]
MLLMQSSMGILSHGTGRGIIKIWIIASILSMWQPAHCVVHSALSLNAYASKIFSRTDRYQNTTAGLSTQACRNGFMSLRSCYLANQDTATLNSLSRQYLTQAYHGYRPQVQERQVPLVLSPYFPSLYSATSKRRRRRYLNENLHERRERSITSITSGNPCVNKISKKITIFYGIDSSSGQVVELLQDPEQHLYQTFYVFECSRSFFLNFLCETQYVEFLAAVYVGPNFEVAMRQIKIPTHCSLSVGRSIFLLLNN